MNNKKILVMIRETISFQTFNLKDLRFMYLHYIVHTQNTMQQLFTFIIQYHKQYLLQILLLFVVIIFITCHN